jgi:hypothetical protein
MERLDDLIAGRLGRGSVAVTVLAAVLLGLRHATDPDHLVAVTTLIVSDRPGRFRRALRLGLSLGARPPALAACVRQRRRPCSPLGCRARVRRRAIVIVLALRLLIRARRRRTGRAPARPAAPSASGPQPAGGVRGRDVHGAGGSAGVTVLLLANIADSGSRSPCSCCSRPRRRSRWRSPRSGSRVRSVARPISGRLQRLLPAMGIAGLAFGAFYVATAVGA